MVVANRFPSAFRSTRSRSNNRLGHHQKSTALNSKFNYLSKSSSTTFIEDEIMPTSTYFSTESQDPVSTSALENFVQREFDLSFANKGQQQQSGHRKGRESATAVLVNEDEHSLVEASKTNNNLSPIQDQSDQQKTHFHHHHHHHHHHYHHHTLLSTSNRKVLLKKSEFWCKKNPLSLISQSLVHSRQKETFSCD